MLQPIVFLAHFTTLVNIAKANDYTSDILEMLRNSKILSKMKLDIMFLVLRVRHKEGYHLWFPSSALL